MSTTTSKPLKPKRGTTAQNNGYTGEAYEVTLDTDKKTLVVHDGLTAGGFPLARADEVAQKDAQQDAAISAAKSSADNALPKSGGTMTGNITIKLPVSKKNPATGEVRDVTFVDSDGVRLGILRSQLNQDSTHTLGILIPPESSQNGGWIRLYLVDDGRVRINDNDVLTSDGYTVTGDMRSSALVGRYCKTDTTGSMVISGGTDVQDGASIHLFGKDSSSIEKGAAFFSSMETDGTRHFLKYNANGYLQDDWNSVLTYGKTFRFDYFSGNQVVVPSGGTWTAFIVSANDNTDYCSGNIFWSQAGGTVITVGANKNAVIFIREAW